MIRWVPDESQNFSFSSKRNEEVALKLDQDAASGSLWTNLGPLLLIWLLLNCLRTKTALNSLYKARPRLKNVPRFLNLGLFIMRVYLLWELSCRGKWKKSIKHETGSKIEFAWSFYFIKKTKKNQVITPQKLPSLFNFKISGHNTSTEECNILAFIVRLGLTQFFPFAIWYFFLLLLKDCFCSQFQKTTKKTYTPIWNKLITQNKRVPSVLIV